MSSLDDELEEILKSFSAWIQMAPHSMDNHLSFDQAISAIKAVVASRLPEKSTHTHKAEVHFNSLSNKFPCCDRVQSYNRAIDEVKKILGVE